MHIRNAIILSFYQMRRLKYTMALRLLFRRMKPWNTRSELPYLKDFAPDADTINSLGFDDPRKSIRSQSNRTDSGDQSHSSNMSWFPHRRTYQVRAPVIPNRVKG